MRAVFDDPQVVPPGDVHDSVHVAGAAREVDHKQRLGARGDARLDGCGIDGLRFGIDVRKHGCGPGVDDRIDGRAEGHGRADDLVAVPEIEREAGQMQARRARVQGRGLSDALVGREIMLELVDLGTRAEPRGAQAVEHFVHFRLFDEGLRKNEKCVAHG